MANQQDFGFYESKLDMLRALVAACGGMKAMAAILFPEKSPSEGARYLSDCLNEDRPANLPSEKEHLLLKTARAKGIHFGMAWILEDLGYAPPIPIEPADQEAEAARQLDRKVDELMVALKRHQTTRVKLVGT